MRSGVLIWALSFALCFSAPPAFAEPDEKERKAIEVLFEVLNHWEPTRNISELRLFNQPGLEGLVEFERSYDVGALLVLRYLVALHAEGKLTEAQQKRGVNLAAACIWGKQGEAKPALIQFLSRSKYESVRLLAIEALHSLQEIDDDYTERVTNQGSINYLRRAYYQEVSAAVRALLLIKLSSYGVTPGIIVTQVSPPQHPPKPTGWGRLAAFCPNWIIRKSNQACFVKDY